MSSPRFETFLARLYCDEAFLDRFLASPDTAAAEAGLDEREKRAAAAIDRVGLMMAAQSYRAKRQQRNGAG
jgi:hypothetical protein